MHGIEIDARRRSDTRLLQHVLAEIEAVIRQMSDIRVEIERAVGRGDGVQSQAWKRIQKQLPIALIDGDMAIQFFMRVQRR